MGGGSPVPRGALCQIKVAQVLVGRGQARIFFVQLMLFLERLQVASEEVVLELVKCKCLPILLYGLECCPLSKSDVKSLDFAVTRFLMKLFKSVNLDLINECRFCFNSYYSLHSELLEKRIIAKFQKKIRRHWPHNTIFWQKFSQFVQYM